MAVKDTNVLKTAKFVRECISVPIVTAINQADTRAAGILPGFAFEIVKIEAYASAVTAAITCMVKIGTANALSGAITPAAASTGIVQGSLHGTRANRRGAATDAINVHYTTDGSGAATNLRVTVWIRPLPLNGEVYSV